MPFQHVSWTPGKGFTVLLPTQWGSLLLENWVNFPPLHPLICILNVSINGSRWNSWNPRMWPTALHNKAMINKIIRDFIKRKNWLYYKENKPSGFHGIMATARETRRGIIPVLQITTPTRKGVQDVTLQLLHQQEKISMADHCLREMSVFPASVLGEALTGINSFLGDEHSYILPVLVPPCLPKTNCCSLTSQFCLSPKS